MYGRRCKAIIWNDVRNPARGEIKRTCFVANYICDDGYPTLEDCKAAVPHPEKWGYVCFCDNWYAVNAQSYNKTIVVSKERVHIREYRDKYTQYDPVYAPISKGLKAHSIGPVYWTDGIYRDFMRIDPYLRVVRSNGAEIEDPLTVSNTVVTVGIQFFATDICIMTKNYVNHVFMHYYNDRSMEDNYEEIKHLRKRGIEYWNPFSKNTAVDEKDKNRQKRAREKGIDMGEIIDDREILGGQRIMDESDIFADMRANGMSYEGFSYVKKSRRQ